MKKYTCEECGEKTTDSHYRKDENETVCEDCWHEYMFNL
jgi:formylmethanofuran dehydrogenase subunit E